MKKADQLEMYSQLPTTTAHQSRLQVFQPTRRPTITERRIETPWGHAFVTGRLGQAHADLVEAMCRNAEDWRKDDEGRLHVLVDPHVLRKSMAGNVGGSRYPLNRISALVKDLMSAVIEMHVPKRGIRVMGQILNKVEESPMTRVSHNGTERQMWRCILSDTFLELLSDDLPLHYDPAPLALLKTGIAQAVARHMLTHEHQPNGGWKMDSLLEFVGVDVSNGTQLRNRRRELYEAAGELEVLGIIVDRETGRVIKKTEEQKSV